MRKVAAERIANGSTAVQYFTPQDGAVMLELEGRQYFPDSAAVDDALRSLIALIPQKKRAGAKTE